VLEFAAYVDIALTIVKKTGGSDIKLSVTGSIH
jgi:hypothetical protein